MMDLEIYYVQLRKGAQDLTSTLFNKKKKETKVSKRKNGTNGNGVLHIKSVVPLTKNQEKAFDAFRDKNLLLHGWAGTGKTFVALYLSLKEILSHGQYDKIYIVRSAVASRNIGYLPGDLDEKLEVFETPYANICNELLSRADGYRHLKEKGMIEFVSTSYLRGVTLEHCIILVDEIQNCDWGELSTITTRLGNNIRIVFCGDYRQSDFRGIDAHSKQDVRNFMHVISKMKNNFVSIEFGTQDIIRGEIAKEFLLTAYELGYDGM